MYDIITGSKEQNPYFKETYRLKIHKIRKVSELNKLSSKDINVVLGGTIDLNRKILENKKTDILLSPHCLAKKDKMHFRNSGLNQVLCKIAKKNNIALGISFSQILNSKKRGQEIGRIMQNIKFCQKYGVKIVLGTFAEKKWELRTPKDLISYGLLLGMNPKEAKQSLENIKQIMDEKKHFISKGVKWKKSK